MIAVADVGDFGGVAVQIPSSAEREIEEGLASAPSAGVPWSPCAGFEYLYPDRGRGDLRASHRGEVVLAPRVEVDRSAMSRTLPANGVFSGTEGREIEIGLGQNRNNSCRISAIMGQSVACHRILGTAGERVIPRLPVPEFLKFLSLFSSAFALNAQPNQIPYHQTCSACRNTKQQDHRPLIFP